MKRIGALTLAAVVASGVAAISVAGGDKPYGKAASGASAKLNIVETAVAAGDFNTLVAAVKAAGLAEALSGPGPFTVFAPTDAAFAKLPAGTVESLLKPENKDTLATILKYHVIQGEVLAADVVKMKESSSTLAGQTFQILVKDGAVKIGNDKAMANVVKTDIKTTNGVIHVIDAVILPN